MKELVFSLVLALIAVDAASAQTCPTGVMERCMYDAGVSCERANVGCQKEMFSAIPETVAINASNLCCQKSRTAGSFTTCVDGWIQKVRLVEDIKP